MRLIYKNELLAKTGLSNSTRHRLEVQGAFPMRRQITPGKVAWIEAEIDAWIESRELYTPESGAVVADGIRRQKKSA